MQKLWEDLICSVCCSNIRAAQNRCCLRECIWFRDKEYFAPETNPFICSCVAHAKEPETSENEFPAIKQKNICSHRMSTATLPEFLDFFWSPNDELGVKSRIGIQKKSVFGPLVAPLVLQMPMADSSNLQPKFQIKTDEAGSFYHLLDSDLECNWMKHVRFAGTQWEANLLAFQYDGRVYFVAVDDIPCGQELVVSYTDNYGPQCNKVDDSVPLSDPQGTSNQPCTSFTVVPMPKQASRTVFVKGRHGEAVRKVVLPPTITRVEHIVKKSKTSKSAAENSSSSVAETSSGLSEQAENRRDIFVFQPTDMPNLTNAEHLASQPERPKRVTRSTMRRSALRGVSENDGPTKELPYAKAERLRRERLADMDGFFKCRICHRGFLFMTLLSDHYDEQHPNELKVKEPYLNLPVRRVPYYACVVCRSETQFDSMDEAVSHLAEHSEEEIEIAKKVPHACVYTEHSGCIRRADKDIYACEVCGKTMSAARLFLLHVKTQHPEYHSVLMPDAPEDIRYRWGGPICRKRKEPDTEYVPSTDSAGSDSD